MTRSSLARGLMLTMLLVPACARKPAPIVETKGDCTDVFQGQVCTWTRTQDSTILAVGADIPVASIENAPATPDMAWPPSAAGKLTFSDAVRKQTGLTEMTIYWEAEGHPPAPYMTPHFDFHFYTESPDSVAAIDCKDTSKPTTLAAGYALPDQPLPPDMAKVTGVPSLIGICVPSMGMHSLLASEMESKDLFRGSIVLGYYHAKPIFIEPMLTKAMLLEKKSFDLPIPTIPGMTGIYPRTWHATFDSTAQVYHFEFSGFAPAS